MYYKSLKKKDNFGRKVLDGAKYIGKNSWKALPVVGLIDFAINLEKKGPGYLRAFKYNCHGFTIIASGVYLFLGFSQNLWTKKDYENRFEDLKVKQQYESKHYQQINSSYNSLFKDAKNFDDSLTIYNHYYLPIKLEEPTFDEKETAVKINKLEKEIK